MTSSKVVQAAVFALMVGACNGEHQVGSMDGGGDSGVGGGMGTGGGTVATGGGTGTGGGTVATGGGTGTGGGTVATGGGTGTGGGTVATGGGTGTGGGSAPDAGVCACDASSCGSRVCGRSSCGYLCGTCPANQFCFVGQSCQAGNGPGTPCIDAFGGQVWEGDRGFRSCSDTSPAVHLCTCTGGGATAWASCDSACERVCVGN